MRPIEDSFGEVTVNGHEKEQDSEVNGKRDGRLIIGVDFGTTYSGYYSYSPKEFAMR